MTSSCNIQELVDQNKRLLKRIDALEKELNILKQENAQLKLDNIRLKEENTVLKAENAELKRRLTMDSENSSKPPSQDPIGKKRKIPNARGKSDKPPGGQSGHKGHNLKRFENPDEEIHHHVNACQSCNNDLSQVPVDHSVKRQVVDLPPPDLNVTEHIGEVKVCPDCGEINHGKFPEGVTNHIQYGNNIQAMLIYFSVNHHIPYDRLTDICRDVLGFNIAKDTVANAISKLSKLLDPFLSKLEIALNLSHVKHVDETGLKVCTKLKYLHSLGTAWGTLYKISDKRGDVFKGNGVGVLVHDEWQPYMSLDNIKHALCHAHHLRELKSIKENDDEPWVDGMSALLLISHYHCQIKGGAVSDQYYETIADRYDQILTLAIKYHDSLPPLPQKGKRRKRRKGHNLALRFIKHKNANLLFLKDKQVPFTNNLAERDLRMCKVQQKISGGFRTDKGAQNFAAIRSLISTARKMGLNIIETISSGLNQKFPELPITAG